MLNAEEEVQQRGDRAKSSSFQRNGDVEIVEGGQRGRAKYSAALQTLLPYRKETSKNVNQLPSSHAGMFSFVSFTWLTPIMWKAFRHGLTPADLWELHEADKAEKNAKRLSRIWQDEKVLVGPDKASFMKAVWKFGKTRFFCCIFLMIVSICFQFLGPSWILKAVLSYVSDTTQTFEVGIGLAVAALLAQFFRNLTYSAVWAIGIHTGMRVEGAMQYMTYDKMLRLRNGGDNILSKTITFVTNDQERIFECVSGGVLAVAAPVMFLFCLVYTVVVLGPWALLGNFVIFMFYPLMGAIARRTALIRRKAVNYTNKRVGLMTEILASIRLIKMYGWEESFLEKVKEVRIGEERQLRHAAFLQSISATITPMINIFAAVAVFLAYSLSGNNLTSAEAFTLFSVFSAMTFTFGTLPFALRALGEASVCFRNFQKFLEMPEFELVTEPDLECDHDAVVAIKDGNFAWEVENIPEKEEKLKQNGSTNPRKNGGKHNAAINKKPKRNTKSKKPNGTDADAAEANPEEVEQILTNGIKKEAAIVLESCLVNLNLQVKRSSLVGVCGSVGSGKSALISSILGETVKTSGKMLIRGSLAVVPQQAWIYSDSLQENILFGSPMNKQKYDTVLDICCLRADIASFSNGDLTLIGERGVNLSGGQRQRVNLARGIYADKSIYLLDDPLSFVDAVIAKEIFEECIKKHLKDKTVLLITNGIQFLEECDDIIFMKAGEIVEHGSHEQLIVQKDYYYNMIQYHNQNKSKTEESIPLITTSPHHLTPEHPETFNHQSPSSPPVQSFAQKIIEDDSLYKFAGIKAYLRYLQAAGGYFLFGILLIFFLTFGAGKQSSQIWLRQWLDAGDGKLEERKANETEITNKYVYSEPELQEMRGYVNENPDAWFYQLVLVSLLFATLLVGLVKGLMSSRFVLRGASGLHSKMLNRVVNSPMNFFDVTPVGKITNRFSKDLDELDARLPFFFEFVIQSVIFVIMSLLVTALVFPQFVLGMLLVLGIMIFLDIWLNIGVRETRKLENVLKTPVIHHLQSTLNGLSIIRTFHRQDPFKARFSVYVNNHLAAESVYRSANRWFTFRMDCICMLTIFGTILLAVWTRDRVSVALVGLGLSSIYSVCIFIPFVMRMKSELQARFLSVERVLEYSEELEEEEPQSKVVVKPKDGWPSANPSVKFEGVSLRYQENLPFVIQGVTFSIAPAEKIGIVGRTGAGKTSIIAALLRLYPIGEGRIFVGDMDINEISLKDLRSSIAVIPQDPTLFQGTVRYNLDPFNQYSDDAIWTALEKSHIKTKIEKDEKKLLQFVASEGENFSVGEKQLICLTRAILRKNKILLLDEATASLDIETDFLIQNTIRDAFKECTVITIAHRLNTVAFYDRILVMDKGEMIEMDTPQNLMDNKESRFHKMMIASGISNLDQLKMHNDLE